MPLSIPDQTIATKVQTPDAMRSIGGMLDVARGAQAYQAGNIELQKANQANQERIAVQDFMSNPDNFQTNGRIDMDKVNANLTKIAPLTGAEHIQRLSTLSKAQTEADSAKQNLTQSQRALVAGPLGVLGRAGVNDPNVYVNELEGLKKDNPDNKELHRLIDAKITAIKALPQGTNFAKGAIVSSQSLLAPEAQQTALSPQAGLTSTGGQIQPTITTPAVGGNAPSVQVGTGSATPVTLGPGSLENVEQDSLGNKYIVTRSPQGTILGTRPLGAAAPAAGGGGTGTGAPFRQQPGDAQSIPVLEGERNQSRNLLSSAPIAHTTNRGILEELDHVISTGQTGQLTAKVASWVGATPKGNTEAERAASAYDLIGKYTERNALEAAKAMGPGTNMGLEAAIKANGSAAYNPTALKKITKLNDAIVSGVELYQPGLEKAIAADPAKGVLAKRQFDQAWAQNFDPTIMMLNTAQREGDRAEIADIMKSLGGPKSARAQELLRKARNLDKLSQDGKL